MATLHDVDLDIAMGNEITAMLHVTFRIDVPDGEAPATFEVRGAVYPSDAYETTDRTPQPALEEISFPPTSSGGFVVPEATQDHLTVEAPAPGTHTYEFTYPMLREALDEDAGPRFDEVYVRLTATRTGTFPQPLVAASPVRTVPNDLRGL